MILNTTISIILTKLEFQNLDPSQLKRPLRPRRILRADYKYGPQTLLEESPTYSSECILAVVLSYVAAIPRFCRFVSLPAAPTHGIGRRRFVARLSFLMRLLNKRAAFLTPS